MPYLNFYKMYYFLGTLLILLSLFLLIWAIVDIIKNNENKSQILLLLLTPIIGPLIYFQNKKR